MAEQAWVAVLRGKLPNRDFPEEEHWNLLSKKRKHVFFRVPESMKNNANSDSYQPRLVSLGPYYHGDPRLMPMEEHKLRAVSFMTRLIPAEDPLQKLASVVESNFYQVKEAYDDLGQEWTGGNEDKFKTMMLTDGCFLARIIMVHHDEMQEEADPIFWKQNLLGFYQDLKGDIILLENQLPLQLVLELLQQIRLEMVGHQFIRMVLNFLGRNCKAEKVDLRFGIHPLGLLWLSFCNKDGNRSPNRNFEAAEGDEEAQTEPKRLGSRSMHSATELDEAGIIFKACKTRRVHDMDFSDGKLTMPQVVVDNKTAKELLNMMALEQLYGCGDYYISSFVVFMDNLIDSEKDVALLRSHNVIRNHLSSDQEAAELFNNLGKAAVMSPFNNLFHLQHKVNEYCNKRWHMWGAKFKKDHMRNPWVFTALVASVFMLIATFLQTVYTVMSYYNS